MITINFSLLGLTLGVSWTPTMGGDDRPVSSLILFNKIRNSCEGKNVPKNLLIIRRHCDFRPTHKIEMNRLQKSKEVKILKHLI